MHSLRDRTRTTTKLFNSNTTSWNIEALRILKIVWRIFFLLILEDFLNDDLISLDEYGSSLEYIIKQDHTRAHLMIHDLFNHFFCLLLSALCLPCLVLYFISKKYYSSSRKYYLLIYKRKYFHIMLSFFIASNINYLFLWFYVFICVVM